MNLTALPARIEAWFVGLSTAKKVILGLATLMFLVEVGFRTFAPKSKAYASWTKGIEAVGSVWTAVLLSIIYAGSVGPIAAFMRLLGKDPLERKIGSDPSNWHPHDPNPLGPRAAARHQF